MSSNRSNQPVSSCGSCGSHLVQPTGGRRTDSSVWEVELRCPDCHRLEVTYCSEAEVERLDREQDRVAAEMESQLTRLEAVHMQEWTDRFVHALDLDLIRPDDF